MTSALVAIRARRKGSHAFTVTELLVVITLIVILVLIAVPSFQSMLASSEEALAESQLRVAIRSARDAAIRSGAGNDGAAVFFYDRGGRLSIAPYVKVGEFSDEDPDNPGDPQASKTREIFAPAPGFSPVALPRGWVVRGFAPANSIEDVTDGWYSDSTPSVYSSTQANNWVFPETDFFDVEINNGGFARSTFMIRFQAGTGILSAVSANPVLLFAPRASGLDRGSEPFASYRADRADDPAKFVRTILATPISAAPGGLTLAKKRQLLGRQSSDMVLARPVQQVALYNESRMARDFGIQVDRDTGTVYRSPPLTGDDFNFNGYQAGYVTGSNPALSSDRITRWIEGETRLDAATPDNPHRPEAKLYSVDRYSGQMRRMEVEP